MMDKIPELFTFDKGRFELKSGGKDIAVGLIIILVGTAGFGLGRLSRISEAPTPVSFTGAIPFADQTATLARSQSPGVENSGGIYVASKNGRTYALPTCPSANTISEANKIWFTTKEEAERAGYRAAANCKGI